MRFSIGHRLFVAMLLSILVIAAISMELIRWTLYDNFSGRSPTTETAYLEDLRDALSERYRQHRDWSFLPDDTARRKAWLYDEMSAAWKVRTSQPDATRPTPSLVDRIGVLDRDARRLAGAMASPFVVAFASIDTVRRAVVVDGETVGYVVLAQPQNPDDGLAVAMLIERQDRLLLALFAGVVLSAAVAALLAANFRRPIRQLLDATRRLEDGQPDAQLTIRRSDELGELADRFRSMAAKLADVDRSRRQWVADTSHELRTPLSVLRAQVDALQDGVRVPTPENTALIQRQVLALSKLVDELYELARADAGQWTYDMVACDVWTLLRDVGDAFAEKFRAADLTLVIGNAPADTRVRCDLDRMTQVLTNLFENCVRYTATGGRIDIHGRVDGSTLRIAIDDSAPGVPDSVLPRLGERFFRVEESRNRHLGGAGLGIALCKRIIEAHDGRLEFAASPLGGLRATIVLRLAD